MYVVSVRASDGQYTGTLDVTVTVGNINEAPTITGDANLTFPENTATTRVLDRYSATDPERGQITWSLVGDDQNDFLIDQSGNLTFASEPDYEFPTDSGGDNEYDLTVIATDDGSPSQTGRFDVTVTVTPVNEPPSVIGQTSHSVDEKSETFAAFYSASDPEGSSTTFTWSLSGTDGGDFTITQDGQLIFRSRPDHERPADSNRDNIYIFSVRAYDGRYYGYQEVTVTVEDVNEAPEFNSGSRTEFTYRENGTSALYTYRATDPEGGPVTWSRATNNDGGFFTIDQQGRLAFSTSPNFEAEADSDRNNVYNVTVQARDDAFNTASLPVTVTVTDLNEGPTIAGNQTLSFVESTNTVQVLATYTATDPEDPSADITRWSLSGTDGGDFVINEDGELRFRNTPDHERPADSNRDNIYNLSVRASDGRYYGYLEVSVMVDDVNEAPEFDSGSRTEFTYRENSTSSLYTYRATDPERADIEWDVSGPDEIDFTISVGGALSFTNPPDFENPEGVNGNVYRVTVEAEDDSSNTASLPVTVTVTELNEGPTIAGNQTLSFLENTNTVQVLATYSATDPEDISAVITRRCLSGTDGGDFVINDQGELRFRNTPDHERPADSNRDNEYRVTVRASDGRYYGNFEETITVTNMNEPPETRSGSRTEFTYRENGTSSLYTYLATDPEGAPIEWSLSGPNANEFAISETGVLAFASPPDYENPRGSGRDGLYLVTVVAEEDGGLTDSLDVTVEVTDLNEGPTVSGSDNFTFPENREPTLVLGTYTGRDPESPGTPINRWSLSGSDFLINENGELTFRNTPDYDRPADSNRDSMYQFAVRASDGRYYGYLNITVNVTNLNEHPPVVTGSNRRTVREETPSSLYTYRATDQDRGDTFTWSVSGADGRLFDISDRGALTFGNPPDYDIPGDSGGDNQYDVEVEAEYGGGLEGSLAVTVIVTAVNEGPLVSGSSTFAIDENQDLPGASYTASDPEGTTAFRWSTSGRDGGDFTIDENGVLAFRSPPDYERPADSNRDNLYELTVRAYDGRNYGTQDVTVTVCEVNEPPVISGRDTFTYRENSTYALYTYRATDPEGDNFTWSLGGSDTGDFDISERGVLTFRNPPNFEIPVGVNGNEYQVMVQATYDQFSTGTFGVTVTVTDLNEGPEVSGQSTFVVEENFDPTFALGTAYTATDPERAGITRWSLSGSALDQTVATSCSMRMANSHSGINLITTARRTPTATTCTSSP